MDDHSLAGIYAAALTPLNPNLSPKLESISVLLDFLARRGCHGALLLGTTGEGPSFSPEQRQAIMARALEVRQEHPGFRLLAGTGTPSLEESVHLTGAAFDLGYDGVVVLPPYYFRQAGDEGLFGWFSRLIKRAVPPDGKLLGYHFPQVSGVGLSVELLDRLREAFPARFAGLKDSSGDPQHAELLARRLGSEFLAFVGNDHLLSRALDLGLSGSITALANHASPLSRAVWDAHQEGRSEAEFQDRLSAARQVLEGYAPFPAPLKALAARLHGFPRWPVCPPLVPLPAEREERLVAEMEAAYGAN